MLFLLFVIALIALGAAQFYGQRCPKCGQKNWTVDYSKDSGMVGEDLHMHCPYCDERWSY